MTSLTQILKRRNKEAQYDVEDPEQFGLEDTQSVEGPWEAIARSKQPLTEEQINLLASAHTKDPSRAGVPYYFIARKQGDGPRVVFSDQTQYPIGTVEEAAAARDAGLSKGLEEKHVDFPKMSRDAAPGIPDRSRFGEPERIPPGKLLQYVVQRHLAERSGPHYDVRMGIRPGEEAPMLSFATKKELPQPGEKRMLFQQPLHRGQYAKFEGEITEGYGKGVVKRHDHGAIIVTKAQPDKVNFVVAHKKYPEFYTLVRAGGPGAPKTERQRVTQGGSWLLINTTPMDAAKMLGGDPAAVGLKKMRYAKIPAEKVDKLFNEDYLVQAKLDGASALYHLLADRIEALSYRTSKTGRPIIHTHRVFGADGGSKLGIKVPKKYVGSILRGEIYGVRGGKAIPPQELGGILNASVVNALKKQKEQGVELRNMLFDVVRKGKRPVGQLGAEERMQMLREVAGFLPRTKFTLPETAGTTTKSKELWQRIITGKHPLTREGVVGWPKEPGKPPVKVKVRPEADVWVRKVFPSEGRLSGTGAGGFEYSASPEGPIVGGVGTGFDEATRREMAADPDSWVGRLARIRSQERFPSGAHRAPSFISLHEDYPMGKTADYRKYLPYALGAGVFGGSLLGQIALLRYFKDKAKESDPISRYKTKKLLKRLQAQDVQRVNITPRMEQKIPLLAKDIAYGAYFSPRDLKDDSTRELFKSWGLRINRKKWDKAKRHGMVVSSKKYGPAPLAHELSHATGGKMGPVHETMYGWGTPIGVLGSIVAGSALGRMKWPLWKRLGTAGLAGAGLGTAANIPQLYEEARSSVRAHRALKDIGLSEEELSKARKTLGSAYGTYLLGSAAPTAAAALAMV